MAADAQGNLYVVTGNGTVGMPLIRRARRIAPKAP